MINNNKDYPMEEFRKKCGENGLKVTPQRTVIYAEFLRSKDHPSADILYKRVKKALPNISFDTVYRTLQSFYEIGLANVLDGTGEPKRFDPETHKHYHFRCIECGNIYDFYTDLYNDLEIPEEISNEFHVKRKKIILEGICKYCGGK
jgi:Fur family peroxide stress response transcriptional regulator